jgi:gluconolactonase
MTDLCTREWTFERVSGPHTFTEGPVWSGGSVLFTDADRVLRYDRGTGETHVVHEGADDPCGMHYGPDGALYVCESGGRRVARYDEAGEERETVVDAYEGTRLNSPNDLEFDAAGRLWFTDPSYGDDAGADLDHRSVYRIADPTGEAPTAVRVTEDTAQPNGLLVSHEGDRLYVAESEYGAGNDRELRAYPIRADGSVGEHEVLHNFYPHRGIDGMALDSAGNVVATAGWEESGPGPMVYVFAPSGRVLGTHPIEEVPTNCTFAGAGGDLYVTTHGGSLYRTRTDRRGRASP